MLDYAPAIAAIEQAQNILVLPSSPPDGDSLGSALALYLALQKKGKQVTVVCADPVPDAYKFLPDSQSIESDYTLDHDFIVTLDISETGFRNLEYDVKDNKVNIIITPEHGELKPEHLAINQDQSKYDLIITVDTADVKQLGKVYESNQDLFSKIPVINIDHHPSNGNFGSMNLVDSSKASTTLMLTEMFQNYDMSLIDSDVATLLLAGLITDTGSFQNANTTPEAFDTAALLIGLGARQQEIIRHVYKTKELHTLRLWGKVLSNIQTDYEHKVVWSTVTQADFAETNSKENDIGDIIDELLSNAPEAEVVILFKELPEGVTHLSIRTTTDEVNASKIAQNFGGGGHRRAAGANVQNPDFRAVVDEVLNYVRISQQDRLGAPETTTEPMPEEVPVIEQPITESIEPLTVAEAPVMEQPVTTVPEAPIVQEQVVVDPLIPVPENTPDAVQETVVAQPQPITEQPVVEQIIEPPTVVAEPTMVTPEQPVVAPMEQPIETIMPAESMSVSEPTPVAETQPIFATEPEVPHINQPAPDSAEATFELGDETVEAPIQPETPVVSEATTVITETDTADLDNYINPTEDNFIEEVRQDPELNDAPASLAHQPLPEEPIINENSAQSQSDHGPEIDFGDYLKRY